jgi:aminoglycoside phosphotransferase (APT) family kinase protein
VRDDEELSKVFDGVVRKAWKFAGGLSTEMTAVEVEDTDGNRRRYVVRARARGKLPTVATEARLLHTLRVLGLRVPEPCHVDETMTVLDSPYLVLAYIDGAPLVDRARSDAVACAYAAELAAIHQIDGRRDELGSLPRRSDVIGRYLDAPPAELDGSLREATVRSVLRAHWPPSDPERLVLLHGDFFPGNVLWADDEIVAVIDWESAAIGDPLADVGGTRLDLLFAFGRRAMSTFTSHYAALTAADLTNLPLWDLVAALRPAGYVAEWAADWDELGRPDVTEQAMRTAHSWFVDQALAAIDRT